MEKLIKNAFDEVFKILKNAAPKTRPATRTISILDVNPIDLIKFMEEKGIPPTASFDGVDNGYDGWEDIVLGWDEEVPSSEEDKYNYVRSKFSRRSFGYTQTLLCSHGYVFIGTNDLKAQALFDSQVYDFYISGQISKIVENYSSRFKKV